MAEKGGLLNGKEVLTENPACSLHLCASHRVQDPMYLAVQQGQENIYTTLDVRLNGVSFVFRRTEPTVKSLVKIIVKSI